MYRLLLIFFFLFQAILANSKLRKKAQFYVGLGPRLDFIRSKQEVYSELLGDSYTKQSLSVFKIGITGCIGVNFQLNNVILGLKSNYYYRPALLNRDFNMEPGIWGLTNLYKNITIRDCVFDLHFVIGYRFGEKKEKTQPQ